MDSASFQFVFYGLAAALVSNFSRSPVWRSAVLLAASLVFLALLAQNPLDLIPLAAFLTLGYMGVAFGERGFTGAGGWYAAVVIVAYLWLKKYSFLPAQTFLNFPYFTLGLSYIFFRVLHLIFEAGRGNVKGHISVPAYILYTLNFTTLVSGPIQSYPEFARDLFAEDPIPLGPRVAALQLERIVRGFFKVNVLAALIDAIHKDAFSELAQPVPTTIRMLAAFRLAVAYPLFLYANFSGYIDIAIALARLMRIRLPENFDRPFSAASFLDFWNRWHISLSVWLRTYVYNPLVVALMRRFQAPSLEPVFGVFCFFVTFFLIGVWHGRTSEFIVFGILQGGGVSVNKIWELLSRRVLGRKKSREMAGNPAVVAFGRGLTFSWFAFTLFWFWATSKQISVVFGSIGISAWLGVWLAVWLCSTAVLEVWERLRPALMSWRIADEAVLMTPAARVICASVLALASFIMMFLLNQAAPDIVYKAF
jgi:D-alanyl-lipoteichoic acid acyltransferase DltB (MBOAT superfamily)